jgi:hypothetical protein
VGSTEWTNEREVVERLRKRWDTGEWLARLARDEPFVPIRIPLTAPKTADLESDFGSVLDWSSAWSATEGIRVERRRLGGRRIGANDVPFRVWIDSFDELCALLRTRAAVDRFGHLLALTATADPRLTAWAARYPMQMLDLREVWPQLLAAVLWIRDCPEPGRLYLRQIDAPGVDTKLIETNRRPLAGMLDLVLPAERIDQAQSVSRFEARYGFKTKPDYVRFRLIDGSNLNGCTELWVRTDEFHLPPHIETVFIVENEITYLAFPDHPRAAVLLGGGYAVGSRSNGLDGRQVYYWGDIDTHGFAILDRLRAHLPEASSLLMDTDTLVRHETHWVAEPSPTKAELHRLSGHETEVHPGLLADRWGPSVRLEQERIRFSHLAAVLLSLADH